MLTCAVLTLLLLALLACIVFVLSQVLRYGVGQQYKPHMDTLRDEEAGPRVCTILMYLNGAWGGGVWLGFGMCWQVLLIVVVHSALLACFHTAAHTRPTSGSLGPTNTHLSHVSACPFLSCCVPCRPN